MIEPKGHVKPEQLEAMMANAEQRGFVVVDRPAKRLTALLAKR